MHRNLINNCTIVTECKKETKVAMPRIDMASSEIQLPFVFNSKQFLLVHAFSGQYISHKDNYLIKLLYTYQMRYSQMDNCLLQCQECEMKVD